jgi:hypothetical protein
LVYSPSDRSPASNKVHDDGDQSKEQEQVNQKATDVKDEESAEPKQNEHHSENKKHKEPLSNKIAALGARVQVIGAVLRWIRCSANEIEFSLSSRVCTPSLMPVGKYFCKGFTKHRCLQNIHGKTVASKYQIINELAPKDLPKTRKIN